jgi:hypothetical protein
MVALGETAKQIRNIIGDDGRSPDYHLRIMRKAFEGDKQDRDTHCLKR